MVYVFKKKKEEEKKKRKTSNNNEEYKIYAALPLTNAYSVNNKNKMVVPGSDFFLFLSGLTEARY